MQQEALPFKMTPGYFALSIPLLIAAVYAIRRIFKYSILEWPTLKRKVKSWIKADKVDDDSNEPEEIEVSEV
jgi:hypothetical protein